MNVRTVQGKMDLIIDMMEHHEMDVLAVQESRLKKELQTAAKSWAGRHGYSMTAEMCTTSRTGSDDAGVCILSKFPVQPAQMSDNVVYQGRVVAVRARRERNPPLFIVCVYGHASDLFQALTGMGEDYVAIGDWNRAVDESPMFKFIANGMVRYGDEPWQHDLEPSRLGGRHLDYLIHNHNTRIDHRQAVTGVADHQCVFYKTPGGHYDRGSMWPGLKKINKTIPEHEVRKAWERSWSSSSSRRQCEARMSRRRGSS